MLLYSANLKLISIVIMVWLLLWLILIKLVIDILLSRNIFYLKKHFSKCFLEVRNTVKFITIDTSMVLAYKYIFNDTITFNKFHIVQNFNITLNKTWIDYMNRLNTNSIKYKHLKRYCKPLLSFIIKQSTHN